MGFLEIIGSVLTGGATGIIGSLIGKGFDVFNAVQKRKDRVLDYEHELKLIELQRSGKQAEWESERAIVDAEISGSLREASYAHDVAGGRPHRWIISTLRLVRPVLTALLIVLVAVFYFNADAGTQAGITESVLYMASSAVLWWFGDRAFKVSK